MDESNMKNMKTDLEMIGGLAEEYYALFYYNIRENRFNTYTLDREKFPMFEEMLKSALQADIHAKHHEFFIDTVNVNDENILCDKLRLNQVLLNILSNSIKYTPAGGTISMRITEKDVKSNGYASFEFKIKDNGIGMDKEFVKTIYDPFTREKSSTVSGIQGTGLGMAITKNIPTYQLNEFVSVIFSYCNLTSIFH